MTLLERLGGREAITRGIVHTFRILSRRPRPSRHEEAAGEELDAYLRGLGLSPVRDGAGNRMADVPPAPGRGRAPRLILQGHLDMVCAVRPGSGWNPLTDPVTVVEEGGFLRSDGRSSLGADNHLGNAAALWLLSTGAVNHGPLRLLFTTAEEVGLEGAKEVAPDWLAGAEYLLNTDGFHLGRAVVGSASGRRETWAAPLDAGPAPALPAWRLTLSGGRGGHSGDDINRGRANPIKLLAAYLAGLPGGRIASLSGGLTHNAIPAQAEAVVFCPAEPDLSPLRAALAGYRAADPGLTVACAPAEGPERVDASLPGPRPGLFDGTVPRGVCHGAGLPRYGGGLRQPGPGRNRGGRLPGVRLPALHPAGVGGGAGRPAHDPGDGPRVLPVRHRLPRLARRPGQPPGGGAGPGVAGADRPDAGALRRPRGAGAVGVPGQGPGAGHGLRRAGYSGRPLGG